MQKLDLAEIGGKAIDGNFFTDELFGHVRKSVSNLNPKLGTVEDPNYPVYQTFLTDIQDDEIFQISPENISKGISDDLDISSSLEEIYEEMDNNSPLDKFAEFFRMNELLFMHMKMENIRTPFDKDSNIIKVGKNKVPVQGKIYTPFDYEE